MNKSHTLFLNPIALSSCLTPKVIQPKSTALLAFLQPTTQLHHSWPPRPFNLGLGWTDP